MRGFSKAILAGNLVRDPELRATPTGKQACSFTIAVNRQYKDLNGDAQDTVSYIDCTAWGKLGETINQYMKKGSGILVSGRLEQRSWDDKTTGQKRSRVEVVIDDFNFLSGGAGAGGGSYGGSSYDGGAATQSNNTSAGSDVDLGGDEMSDDQIDLDDIPF